MGLLSPSPVSVSCLRLLFPVSGFRFPKIGFGAGKPDSVLHLAVLRSLFLSGRLATVPASGAACATPPAAAYPWLWDGPPSHLFCLAPDGVFRAVPLTRDAVGSYPTFSPLPVEGRVKGSRARNCSLLPRPPPPSLSRRFVFCDTVRQPALTQIARACGEACAASCPMVSGLSSPSCYRARVSPHLGIKERGATTRPRSQPYRYAASGKWQALCRPACFPTHVRTRPHRLVSPG
jgi:hypothetical protein